MNEVYFEIEGQRFGVWNNLDNFIRGAGMALSLEEARSQVDRFQAVAKVDSFHEGMPVRIIRVTREVVQ